MSGDSGGSRTGGIAKMTIIQVKGNEYLEGMMAGDVKRREGIQETAER